METYIAYPKDNKNPEKAIVFMTDIFGLFPNAKLLADEYANNGYLTVIPDLFQGDQISVDDMDSGNVDFPAWLPKHQPANVEPPLESTIKYVRETFGVKKLGAVGYCFGGKVRVIEIWRSNLRQMKPIRNLVLTVCPGFSTSFATFSPARSTSASLHTPRSLPTRSSVPLRVPCLSLLLVSLRSAKDVRENVIED